ncbi:hypothetical protein [Nannocystis sp.]|uniref:hypothetical protein n=1 Tax=Nannocystis sp. TaxID=1962667 RepID=UPI0025E990DB|nr:hypothetical protein [Nannocystis sp.]MBK7830520.1 hypothetical protein [Nannocystis sp.]
MGSPHGRREALTGDGEQEVAAVGEQVAGVELAVAAQAQAQARDLAVDELGRLVRGEQAFAARRPAAAPR